MPTPAVMFLDRKPMGVLEAERRANAKPIEPRFDAILAEQSAAEERVVTEAYPPMGDLLTTADSAEVRELVDALHEHPYRFAVAYLNMARCVKRMDARLAALESRVDGIAYREVL